jgi:hypothetical protein
MCDYFDDFNGDFDNGDCMDEDAFENSFDEDLELDDPLDGDIELDNVPDEGDDLTLDPFFIGGAMAFAYEEGFEVGRRKRLLKG